MTFPKMRRKKKKLLKILTRSGIICKLSLMDGFLQMASCTSERIMPRYKNNLVMYSTKKNDLKNQILNSGMSKY